MSASPLTSADKARVLRERRAAKMALGTDRLQKILNDGGSLKVAKPVIEAKSVAEAPVAVATGSAHDFHDDPETSDISGHTKPSDTELMNQLLGSVGSAPASAASDDAFLGLFGNNPEMAKFFSADADGTGAGGLFSSFMNPQTDETPIDPSVSEEERAYQQQLTAFHKYNLTRYLCVFDIAKTVLLVLMFGWYFFTTDAPFASSHRHVRFLTDAPKAPQVDTLHTFHRWFLMFELAVQSTLYIALSSKFDSDSYQSDSYLMKGLNFAKGLGFLKPTLVQKLFSVVKYQVILKSFMADVAVLVVLLGLWSGFSGL
ncbi:hypothetical protein BABINDRAFT_162652 [Babjeviella inositovora NRRL Y-12698]|uniref:Golgi to ER traffic protein 2 n=1 Tax=Babjeviella inositovora NRRL Y-12698 TaxID=984486 RepID=A0A1E3QL54_9ASCO|nr:uncharacterized protein BABINDRAFT_162652 [Babjeviella inositovora NRRL Y-12698]ODQ78426.1 hypothetical protein BABINDRAFT_162652 [Babjeviella inositovora NRRL Y-12698]